MGANGGSTKTSSVTKTGILHGSSWEGVWILFPNRKLLESFQQRNNLFLPVFPASGSVQPTKPSAQGLSEVAYPRASVEFLFCSPSFPLLSFSFPWLAFVEYLLDMIGFLPFLYLPTNLWVRCFIDEGSRRLKSLLLG